MKKLPLLFFSLMLMTMAAAAEDDLQVRQHIAWSNDNILISHPYYIDAKVELNALSHDLKIDFTTCEKENSWAMVLIRLDNPPETDWTAIKITYRASLPSGMQMRLGLEEDDEITYECFWDAASSGEFVQVVIPRSKLVIGKWCRKSDRNPGLDADKVKTVLIGAGGLWNGSGSSRGCIEIRDIGLMCGSGEKLP